MVRNPLSSDKNDFDKGDLKDELENAGFEDCVADNIADRVDDRKDDSWTADTGRQEALKEIEMFIDNTRRAYDNYRQKSRLTSESTSSPMY